MRCSTLYLVVVAGLVAGCSGSRAAKPRAGAVSKDAAPAATSQSATLRMQSPVVRQADEVLDRSLGAKDADIRAEALVAVAVARRHDAGLRLVDALEAEKGELRFAAARGLFYLRDPSTAPVIAKAFRREKGWSVKKELAYAAGACGAKELIPELEKAVDDLNPELQAAAALALDQLGAPGAKEALVRAGNPKPKGPPKEGTDRWSRKVLAGTKEGDRALAAKTLAEIGTAADVALLEPLLGSDVMNERIWAAAGILRIARQKELLRR